VSATDPGEGHLAERQLLAHPVRIVSDMPQKANTSTVVAGGDGTSGSR
jgi:hypothetical protein